MVMDSPLSEERFNEINRLKTISPEQMDSVSENEARQFEELAVSIEDLNAKYQEQTTIIIQDEGLTLEEFQLIANYVNQNPEIMEERMN
jgi:ABC-type transport system involved in cytochrome bd biosynthesis fused ATPase/permease subunit